MDLKSLIGEENFKKLDLSDAQKKAVEDAKLFDPKEHVPKKEFNEKIEAHKNLETEKNELQKKFETINAELTKLKDEKEKGSKTGSERIEKLEKELEDMKLANEQKSKELLLEKNRGILRSHLTEAKANPKYFKVLESEFDLEKLEIDESTQKIKDFDDKIKSIKDSKKELFGEFQFDGNPPGKGKDTDITEMSSEDFYESKMK